MISVIGFIFEVIGMTYGKLIIIFFGFAFGFVDGFSRLHDTHFMLRVIRFWVANLVNDYFCWCGYIRSILLNIWMSVMSEESLYE